MSSCQRRRFVPVLHPLEDRHLLSPGAGLPSFHRFSSAAEFRPSGLGPSSGMSGMGPKFAPSRDSLAWSFAPDHHGGLRGPFDRGTVSPSVPPASSSDAGRDDGSDRRGRFGPTSAERSGPAARVASPTDLLPVAAPAGVIISLIPTVHDSTFDQIDGGPSTAFGVDLAGRPIKAGLSDTSQDLGTPGSLRGSRAAPVPDLPGIDHPDGPIQREGGPRSRPADVAPIEVPPPRGADLISDFAPFDRAALDRAVSRLRDLFGRLGRPLSMQPDGLSYLFPVLAGIAAIEAVRRWRHRRISTRTARAPRAAGSMLRGFF